VALTEIVDFALRGVVIKKNSKESNIDCGHATAAYMGLSLLSSVVVKIHHITSKGKNVKPINVAASSATRGPTRQIPTKSFFESAKNFLAVR